MAARIGEMDMGTLLLLDGNSIINRAYYGVKSSTTLSTADGTPTNAVFGFVNILNKHLEDIQPDHMAVAFDTKAPTFRHGMYDGYKGDRKGMPDELAVQMPLLKELLDAMGIRRVELEGLEADDFIGILSKVAESAGMDVIIVTGDRDALQLVSDRVTVMIPSTGKGGTETNVYRPADVQEKYGVSPMELIEVKGLMGDPSDSIPGVPSVGEKTALGLIQQYGSVEGVYAHLDEIKRPVLHRNLKENKELAFLSRKLGIIVRETDDLPEIAVPALEKLAWGGLDRVATRAAFEKLEFRSLIRRFGLSDVSSPNGAAANAKDEDVRNLVEKALQKPFFECTSRESLQSALARHKNEQSQADTEASLVLADPTGTATETAWQKEAELAPFQMSLMDPAPPSPPQRLVLALALSEAVWVLRTGPDLSPGTAARAVVQLLKGVRTVYCYDLKALTRFFDDHGEVLPEDMFDVMLAEYLIDPSRSRYLMRDMAARHLGAEVDTPDQLLSDAGARQAVTPDAYGTAVRHAAALLPQIGGVQRRLMQENGQISLYETVERPLAVVLAEMERDGFRVDPQILEAYGKMLNTRIHQMEKEIHELAGEAFNILSPKQLGVILFEKLGLPFSKKTKTGYATDAEVLEKLAESHPIVPLLLEYRQYSKLKSTYADGLLKEISSCTGRVHSRFNQTVTVTGRISSTEPNLQNIPIRTELGRHIRKAFLPKEGYLFCDADYSQIELRVLAHVTGDKTLRQAFLDGTDIHALTASQVFHVPLQEVTGEMRRRAKAVNFGIIYGISDYGLARDLGIYRNEANTYIEGYLDTYPDVRTYMETVVEQAKTDGYVETLLRRRRYLPELKSPNFNVRSFGKRVALNTPIQGTAADIIKLAMIRVRDALRETFPEARLILQVHDELIVEVPGEQAVEVGELVRRCMEGAMELSVPLVADVGIGPTWYDAKA